MNGGLRTMLCATLDVNLAKDRGRTSPDCRVEFRQAVSRATRERDRAVDGVDACELAVEWIWDRVAMRRIAAVFLFLVCLACVVSGIALLSGLGFNDIARSVRFLAGLILAVVGLSAAAVAFAMDRPRLRSTAGRGSRR